ncbi:putative membrane protein YphA (DoxX/SURF4 family) [Sinobacterium caligoides]|uniref:Putative membrane protein YphA (DoxX/SURF4 family) n=1 Tax=Sinobacterium caligoides TaxID=933926 RepID=A0A3N2E248_9GAMM|nr:DoxX family protein [Sinobacterium caligoides]ROS05769.1 putative membrane protein YphA (DoxX/SURF4 family) [Sinobacterium caligoides]
MESLVRNYYHCRQKILALLAPLSALTALGIRLYLAPIFIAAGLHKLYHLDDIASWFGNPDWGLGLPAPMLMAMLAAITELVGGVLLAIGLMTRWATLPLIITMWVAIVSVHWPNGWFAIAPSNPSTSTAAVLAPLGFPGARESLHNSEEVADRLTAANTLLERHGHYDWLTAKGKFVILNNGIEFAVTYLLMLLSLLFSGGGRYVSIDYWLARHWQRQYPGLKA